MVLDGQTQAWLGEQRHGGILTALRTTPTSSAHPSCCSSTATILTLCGRAWGGWGRTSRDHKTPTAGRRGRRGRASPLSRNTPGNPDTYVLGNEMPVAPGGRQAHLPSWVYVIVLSAVGVFDSVRSTVTALAGTGEEDLHGHNFRYLWNAVLDRAAHHVGADVVAPLRERTVRDHHVDYFKRVDREHLTDTDTDVA